MTSIIFRMLSPIWSYFKYTPLMYHLLYIPLALFVLFVLFVFLCRVWFYLLSRLHASAGYYSFGFLHPFNLAGGGGERVLWEIIYGLITKYSGEGDADGTKAYKEGQEKPKKKKIEFLLYSNYTSSEYSMRDILERVREQFGITISPDVFKKGGQFKLRVVSLKYWVRIYECFSSFSPTLLLQACGSVILGLVALLKFPPDCFVDTTGFAFTYPTASLLAGCKVVSYVHYPTISNDMLQSVKNRETRVHNPTSTANSASRTCLKLLYYRFFAYCYGICGFFSDVVMCNSTWTAQHIRSLWGSGRRGKVVHIVFPPVNVKHFLAGAEKYSRKPLVVSIGQFRREKDHPLQVRSFARLFKEWKAALHDDGHEIDDVPPDAVPKLVLIGGVRNEEDQARLDEARSIAKELEVAEHVRLLPNASFDTLCRFAAEGLVGLHCMKDEHFGICVVEYQAAGLVALAHRSAGPYLDIVDDGKSGYLAEEEEEYAAKMKVIFEGFNFWGGARVGSRRKDDLVPSDQMQKVLVGGKESAARFTEEVFLERVKTLL